MEQIQNLQDLEALKERPCPADLVRQLATWLEEQTAIERQEWGRTKKDLIKAGIPLKEEPQDSLSCSEFLITETASWIFEEVWRRPENFDRICTLIRCMRQIYKESPEEKTHQPEQARAKPITPKDKLHLFFNCLDRIYEKIPEAEKPFSLKETNPPKVREKNDQHPHLRLVHSSHWKQEECSC